MPKIAYVLIVSILLISAALAQSISTGQLGKMDHDSWKDGYTMGKAVGVLQGMAIIISETSSLPGHEERVAKYNEIASGINFGIQFKNMQLQLLFPNNYSDVIINPIQNISLPKILV